MGERITPECDIFKTLQPKGLRTISVNVSEYVEGGPDTGKTLFGANLEVSSRGLDRIVRMVKAATQPPKTRQGTDGEAAGNA